MAFSYSLGTRTTAVATAVATTCCTIAVPAALSPALASSPAKDSETTVSAEFLSRQLKTGTGVEGGANLLPGVQGASDKIPADVGMTTDYVLTLKALGVDSDQQAASYKALTAPAQLDPYLTFDGTIDANRLAKTVALDVAMGNTDSPRIEQLVSTVQTDGQAKDLKDGKPADAVTNFGQAWATIALKKAGKDDLAKKSAEFLAQQVCADGGIPLYWKAEPHCDSVDPDTTGLAAQALAYVLGKDDQATQSAVEYLRDNQDISGGMKSRFAGINANTTALAAGAFLAVGDTASFAKAHAYLDASRFGSTTNKTVQGAFAQTPEGTKDQSLTDAIRRTSAQATLAFAGHNYIGSTPITEFEPYNPQEPQPDPDPDPQPNPSPKDEGSSGDSTVGIAFGIIAAVVAVIVAIAAAMNVQLPKGL